MNDSYYITFRGTTVYITRRNEDFPLPDIRFKPHKTIHWHVFYDLDGFIPIYGKSKLFNKLLSLYVCFDMMPDKDVRSIFKGNRNRFAHLYDPIQEKCHEIFNKKNSR